MSTASLRKPASLFDGPIVRRAVVDALRKLHPRRELRNPVMSTVYVGSIFTSALCVALLFHPTGERPGFVAGVSCWLWVTVLFANFAEAMAEGRGKAQADTLRRARRELFAKRLPEARRDAPRETV